jgi:hypothetical protein
MLGHIVRLGSLWKKLQECKSRIVKWKKLVARTVMMNFGVVENGRGAAGQNT